MVYCIRKFIPRIFQSAEKSFSLWRKPIIFTRKYRSWKQEKEKNAYLIEIEEILPAYSLSCIKGNRLRKEWKSKSSVTKSFEKR